MEINLHYAEFSPACLSQCLARLHEAYQDGQAEIPNNHLNDSPSRFHTLCLCNLETSQQHNLSLFLSCLFKNLFGYGSFFKVPIECVIALLFSVSASWPQSTWGPSSPARDQTCTCCTGEISTTGRPGKSLLLHFRISLPFSFPGVAFYNTCSLNRGTN